MNNLLPLLFLFAGVTLTASGLLPHETVHFAKWFTKGALWLLFLAIGFSMGREQKILNYVKMLGFRVILVPAVGMIGGIIVGTAAGVLAGASFALASASAAGSAYYGLTTIVLGRVAGPEGATLGFMTNMIREFFVILGMPLLVSLFGKTGAVGAAGAAAMDTALPFIIKSTGKDVAMAAFCSGVAITAAVPVIVPLCYRLFS